MTEKTQKKSIQKRLEKPGIIVVTVLVLIAVHFYTLLYTPVTASSSEAVTGMVTIPRGAGFRVIANTLVKEGFLKDAGGINLAARLRGAHKKIKAGEYELSTSMTPIGMLDVLVTGRTKQYAVTFPEGYNIKDIGATLEGAGLVKKEDFIRKATDRKFATKLLTEVGILSPGTKAPSFEGYLFPDTYRFPRVTTPEEIIGKMAARFKEVFGDEAGGMVAASERSGLTVKEIVTLASIIEKEAGKVEEMVTISAVFHNRLKKGYRLESDPTVIYGIEGFDGNLTRRHLKTHTPYNTYVIYGMPPGPIANPGKAALVAALNPAPENYLYFVSRNDGTHKFSSTLREHNRAVELYQKSRRRRPKG